MPKHVNIAGADRYNLMLSIVGYLVHAEADPTLKELAARFDLTEKEVEKAIGTITVSGVGNYLHQDLFDIWIDDVEDVGPGEDRYVTFRSSPAMDDLPRISARQIAAISTGLNYLLSIPGFAQKDEIQELLDILAAGSATEPVAAIDLVPAHVDSDVTVLRKAISEQRRISCNYQNAKGEVSDRQIDPLLLEARDDVWTLRGYCLKNHEVRAFRLDRMQRTEILDTEIGDEAKAAVLTEEIYVPKDTDYNVMLELEPEAFSIIGDFRAEPIAELADGKRRVTVKVGNLKILGPVIARFGGAAKVVEPAEARAAVREFALQALGRSTTTAAESE